MKYYLASACLLGIKSRYDGKDALNLSLRHFLKNKPVLIICPEKLGGLSTPRLPAQITTAESDNPKKTVDGADVLKGNARVHNKKSDVTNKFINGASKVVGLLNYVTIPRAYLKSRSPSCGYRKVYCRAGRSSSRLTNGNGVLTSLLIRKKIRIKSI